MQDLGVERKQEQEGAAARWFGKGEQSINAKMHSGREKVFAKTQQTAVFFFKKDKYEHCREERQEKKKQGKEREGNSKTKRHITQTNTEILGVTEEPLFTGYPGRVSPKRDGEKENCRKIRKDVNAKQRARVGK